MTEINLPLCVKSGKKNYWLTLNNYRNWHFQVSNNVKKKFKKMITDQLDFEIKGQVKIQYYYYSPNNAVRDLMNVTSVIDKFFQDALVENGCIEADDLSIVPEVNCKFVKLDRSNPRLVAVIEEYIPEQGNIELNMFDY